MTLNGSTFFMTKAEASNAFSGASAISKRSLPTLGAILKVSRLLTLLRPAVVAFENEQMMTATAAERVINPASGQEIVVSPTLLQGAQMKLGMEDSGFADPGIRLTKEDLPKIKAGASDEDERAEKSRAELAQEVSLLGVLFTYDPAE